MTAQYYEAIAEIPLDHCLHLQLPPGNSRRSGAGSHHLRARRRFRRTRHQKPVGRDTGCRRGRRFFPSA